MSRNATLLHPDPPHTSERLAVGLAVLTGSVVGVMVVAGSVVSVMVVAGSVVGGSVLTEVVAGFVGWTAGHSLPSISAQSSKQVMKVHEQTLLLM